MELIVTIVVLAGGVGALIGWWRGTRHIANPPDRFNYPPGGMTLQQHLSLLRKKHRKRRLPLAIGSGLAASAATFVALLAFAVLRR